MTTLVGKYAPNFKTTAVLPDGRIKDLVGIQGGPVHQHTILFFYPMDFTFVCPTELIALNKAHAELTSLNAEVLVVSTDSVHCHAAYRNTPVKQGGLGKVKYTMLSDQSHAISEAYGVLTTDGVALRATFIIDKSGLVQSQVVNNLPIGRNIQETIRTLKALQFHEQHGELCPANWQEGDKGIKT